MLNFQRNNLDKATSPYLQQHSDNPIYWQDWSSEVLKYAKKHNKLIFVSVGYATCHWCHVMANDTFEDKEVADFLNKHFVSIKVDREQRPDIDQYMMSFIVQTQGAGGWPLNVILTPDLKPLLAVTYVSAKPQHGMPAFVDVLHRAKDFYEKHEQDIKEYHIPIARAEKVSDIIKIIQAHYDSLYGGFGFNQKFPPHNTLLFLLHHFERTKEKEIREIIEKTLNIMALRGLYDHLQGGFFRYCVDREWTIPHFEKMLYDQAMLLWVYSAAYKLLKKTEYKRIAEKIISCLEETFEERLFYSAHDADTDHKEGATYTWSKKELKEALTRKEFSQFIKVYSVSDQGNFEGKNHLLKSHNVFLDEIENKLLKIRKKRKQPFIDKKFITSLNALTGIALLMAYRFIGNKKALDKAKNLFERLLQKHLIDGRVYHSSIGNKVQKQEFLEDYASMLLFATYMHEETGQHRKLIESLYSKLRGFYKDVWYETRDNDFIDIPAQMFDHPTPSSVSLAEYAILRTKIFLGKEFMPNEYKEPLNYDFFNISVFVKNGNFHIIETPEKIDWKKLPLNCIQLRSKTIKDCFNTVCKQFKSIDEMIKSLKE